MADKGIIKWQKPMQKVLYALTPAVLASVYFFGWRSLAVLAAANLAAYASEYCFARYYKDQVTSAVFVSATLFALSLPPNIPFSMAVIGIIFGIVFGKMVFGGFGKNVFNPAIAGRAFIYINFSTEMTGRWFEPFRDKLGGLSSYTTDAVCGATPMQVLKSGGEVSLLDLLVGNTAGCFGETCAALLIIGGLYLFFTKTANYRLTLSCVLAAAGLQAALYYGGVQGALPPLHALLSGGFVLAAIFMVTDPVSAPKSDISRWIYGALIGVLTVVIRTFSIWAEGAMFAILLGNMFAPLIDYAVNEIKSKKKKAA
ncbi:MAG: RnfABCDGE type electron transport complex subunit D [Victivallales bacterium]|nr:RnfABCDGE type electron transport complex subunit D [Victivallales bacterium]